MRPPQSLILTTLASIVLLGHSLTADVRDVSAQATAPNATGLVVQPESDQPHEEIRRGYFWLSLAPGQTYSVRVVVKNTGSEPLVVRSYPTDSLQLPDGGVDYSGWGKPLEGVGAWISLDHQEFTLGPDEAQRLVATIRVPNGSPPGEYTGGIAVEDKHPRPQAGGGNFLIDVRYRQVLGVVAALPGPTTVKADISTVQLAPKEKGSRALLDVRNAGTALLRAKGTIAIGGGQATTGPLPFTLSTVLPGQQATVPIDLPNLTLQPGAYQVRVNLESPDHGRLAEWSGSVTLQAPGQAQTLPPPQVVLDPARPLETAQDLAALVQHTPILWGVAGLLLLVLGAGIATIVNRWREDDYY